MTTDTAVRATRTVVQQKGNEAHVPFEDGKEAGVLYSTFEGD